MENVVARFGTQLFHLGKELGGSRAMSRALVGALFQLFLVALLLGKGTDIVLTAKAQRTDDGQWHLAYDQQLRFP